MLIFAAKSKKMKIKFAGIYIVLLLFLSCGEYNKILKEEDAEIRFQYAKQYFEQGKFSRSATLLEDVVRVARGTTMGEEALYLLAQSYYNMKDYATSSTYFKSYNSIYPRGEYAELAHYYSAYGLYLNSPDARLDQTDTYSAMQQFQDYLELYPQSERKDEVQNALFELQEKLALKELISVRLYYNLGDYLIYPFPGGNYLSCVITAESAMHAYPFSKYREDFMYYMFQAKYEMAIQSVNEKKESRYREVVDEFHAYSNEYPEGKYMKEIKKRYQNIEEEMKNE